MIFVWIKLIIFFIMLILIIYLWSKIGDLKIQINENLHTIQQYKIKVQDIYELDIPCKNREIQKLTETINTLQTQLQEERDTHKIEMTVRIKPSQVFEVKEFVENLK